MLMISLLGLGCLLIVISKQRRSISMLRKRSPVQPPTHATAYLFAEQLTKSDKKADDRWLQILS
ncbi:unnamed protein product [Gongylonema pulchrum]|uniref:Secreted protein n=1 Tax=Gongylonema pulchrum TaxID=637853 RepID=A0A183DL12_9BILA|nr:unnamed protein product [Gongylonema pulchrum]